MDATDRWRGPRVIDQESETTGAGAKALVPVLS
jgi:hypothetical protein